MYRQKHGASEDVAVASTAYMPRFGATTNIADSCVSKSTAQLQACNLRDLGIVQLQDRKGHLVDAHYSTAGPWRAQCGNIVDKRPSAATARCLRTSLQF